MRRGSRATTRCSCPRYALVALGSALVFVSATDAFAQSQDPGEVAAQVHSEGGYPSDVQFTGPGGTLPQGFPGGGGGSNADERRDAANSGEGIEGYRRGSTDPRPGRAQDPGWNFPTFSGGGAFSQLLLILLVIALVLLVIALAVAMWPRGDRPPPARAAEPARPVTQTGNEALPWHVGDPDELAAQGRFSEAILALLVMSLKRVGWREDQRSTTAREILRTVADAREVPLRGVVTIAERVRFAGDPADQDSFLEARRLHQELSVVPA